MYIWAITMYMGYHYIYVYMIAIASNLSHKDEWLETLKLIKGMVLEK